MLSEHDTRHAVRTITFGKADTAAEVAQNIRDMKNCSISVDTVRRTLKKAGLKAVVKKKKPKQQSKTRTVLTLLWPISTGLQMIGSV